MLEGYQCRFVPLGVTGEPIALREPHENLDIERVLYQAQERRGHEIVTEQVWTLNNLGARRFGVPYFGKSKILEIAHELAVAEVASRLAGRTPGFLDRCWPGEALRERVCLGRIPDLLLFAQDFSMVEALID